MINPYGYRYLHQVAKMRTQILLCVCAGACAGAAAAVRTGRVPVTWFGAVW